MLDDGWISPRRSPFKGTTLEHSREKKTLNIKLNVVVERDFTYNSLGIFFQIFALEWRERLYSVNLSSAVLEREISKKSALPSDITFTNLSLSIFFQSFTLV